MQDLNDLYFFARVVEHGGFAAASRALGVPKSKLSRRIAQLEERLGTRLIQRSTRRFAVTEIGQEYQRHCQALLVQAEAAQEVIARTLSGPHGLVRLSCPIALLDYQVAEMLARYLKRCPGVQLQLESTNRRVDVIAEGMDLAIRVRFPPLEDSDLVMKVLGESTQRLVASPELLLGLACPLTPAHLPTLPSIDEGPPHRQHAWQLEAADGASATIPHQPRVVTDDRLALRIAALHGIGVAQLPTMMVAQDLLAGRLVDVLPGWRPRPAIVHVVFPSRRGLLPAVRQLIDFLAEQFTDLAEIEAESTSPTRVSAS
ncbi:LysR substrate-binding domain-containing protein [Paucibacter sp. M5-1]|uniref:LysR substrate-binding domain-containing protein n=1 Tax=Paucibacter sp. M5-1 TaxID=3015998 RepID=UPI0022B8A12B|nr:LysR substrate-binding domain-containing protein [Paucibacter sp. M5-1]MCZ7880503.1 LysR substrate-binding domain-containing protein [Paucibacter sp. M5-1]